MLLEVSTLILSLSKNSVNIFPKELPIEKLVIDHLSCIICLNIMHKKLYKSVNIKYFFCQISDDYIEKNKFVIFFV
jgi:hypothetical protein